MAAVIFNWGRALEAVLYARESASVDPTPLPNDGFVKQYKLPKTTYVLFALIVPCIVLATGTAWLYIAVTQPQQNAPVWFGVIWMVFALYSVNQYRKIPYRIEVHEDGSIRFLGLRTTTVSPQYVLSLRAFAGGFAQLKYRGGKIVLMTQFTGFHEFITELKRANPNIEVRGC